MLQYTVTVTFATDDHLTDPDAIRDELTSWLERACTRGTSHRCRRRGRPMIAAAIYARKSTKDDNTDEAKSVTRQTTSARAFIATKPGWSLDDEHIYVDDGVSGSLFTSRPEFQRMMRDAAAGVFHVLVFFDPDRFGRNSEKADAALRDLDEYGVEIYDSSTGQRFDLDSRYFRELDRLSGTA